MWELPKRKLLPPTECLQWVESGHCSIVPDLRQAPGPPDLSHVWTDFFIPPVNEPWYAWPKGFAMPGYRLYWMNELDHIERVGEFDADDDATAIAAVERSRGHAPMELWCGTQKVKHWHAIAVRAPPVSA